jgi:hypothetical protein
MTPEQWTAAYAALAPQQAEVRRLFELAERGDIPYSEADTAAFDLNEDYAALAHAASEILR